MPKRKDKASSRLQKRLAGWLAEWGERWESPGLPDETNVEFSSRLTSSLARAYPERGLIRLSDDLRKESDTSLLKEILCHEAAHVAVHRLSNGKAKPHGREWRTLIRKAGFEASVTLPLGKKALRRRRSSLVYLHTCVICGSSRTAKKRMHNWRCSECSASGLEGALEVTTRPLEGGNKNEG